STSNTNTTNTNTNTSNHNTSEEITEVKTVTTTTTTTNDFKVGGSSSKIDVGTKTAKIEEIVDESFEKGERKTHLGEKVTTDR
ncbi:hypothetical protein Q0P46_14100, partial [Staphylococcus aureus]|nr:hypothetical protein [Staphylococcus aureus]